MPEQRPAILALSGSPRPASHSRALAEAIGEGLRRRGGSFELWTLDAASLPFADPRYHHDPAAHPDQTVKRLVASADDADGFVLVTPVYHNSYSGLLKNALDLLSMEQFRYKPVGLAGHGGGRTTQGVDHLRIVVRGLLGIATPTQVCTAAEDYARAQDGTPVLSSSAILERVERFAAELYTFAVAARTIKIGPNRPPDRPV